MLILTCMLPFYLESPMYITAVRNTVHLSGYDHLPLSHRECRIFLCVTSNCPCHFQNSEPHSFHIQSKDYFFYQKWEQCFCIFKSQQGRHICSYLYQFCFGCKITYAILMKLYLNFITSLSNHVIIA